MRISTLAGAVVLTIAVAGASAQPASTLTRQQFKQELEQAAQAFAQPGAGHPLPDLRSIPTEWVIRDGATEFHVPSGWLRSGVAAMGTNGQNREELRKALLRRIKALEAQCDAQAAVQDVASERTHLNAILARREFRKVHGPTWLDELKQKVIQLLLRWLSWLFGQEAVPELGKIFVWLIIIAAVGVLGWWGRRLLVRPSSVPSIATETSLLPPKDWRAWLRDARRAAEAQQWRDAIRMAYWAGVYSLEERGMWRSDRARTPREYLRQADKKSPYFPSLRSLTSLFERTWYAGEPADGAAYARANEALESIECR